MAKKNILIVDDEKEMCWFMQKNLGASGYEASFTVSGEEAVEKTKTSTFDLYIIDYKLNGKNGIEILSEIKSLSPQSKIILMTAHGDHKTAVLALKKGADDFIKKPFDLDDLLFRIYKCIEVKNPVFESKTSDNIARQSQKNLVHASEQISHILQVIDKVAKFHIPVLILGESGTGKNMVASAIHHNTYNPRKDKPYVEVNCSTLSETLLENELFGHTKGAFTGAINYKPGILESIDGGTLFLDELGDTPLSVQAKLLKFLETGEFIRLGDIKPVKVNVRLIAATNKNLLRAVENNLFRLDLYHRINTIEIQVPALRERKNDIPVLISTYTKQHAHALQRNVTFSKEAIQTLCDYHWPGNIRELSHIVQSLILLHEKNIIEVSDLPDFLSKSSMMAASAQANQHDNQPFNEAKKQVVESFEKQYFENLLKSCHWNVSKAARKAKMNRRYLTEKLSYYKLGSYATATDDNEPVS